MTRVKPSRLIAALALLILGVIEFELAVNTTGGQIVDQQLMVGAATSEGLSVFSTEFIGLVTPILIVGGVLVALMITLRNNPIALALRVVVVTLGLLVALLSPEGPSVGLLLGVACTVGGIFFAIMVLVWALARATRQDVHQHGLVVRGAWGRREAIPWATIDPGRIFIAKTVRSMTRMPLALHRQQARAQQGVALSQHLVVIRLRPAEARGARCRELVEEPAPLRRLARYQLEVFGRKHHGAQHTEHLSRRFQPGAVDLGLVGSVDLDQQMGCQLPAVVDGGDGHAGIPAPGAD